MRHFIGIDGGGSKTKFLLTDENGAKLAESVTSSADFRRVGITGVLELLRTEFNEFGADLGESLIGFGVPALGENEADDVRAMQATMSAFPDAQFVFFNDVNCAWAGAHALSPGITMVCGTGSMAVGMDSSGKMVRSGGWTEFFSDEGSGYWLGKKALELFAKQSDARLERGPLYNLMREYLYIRNDVELNGITDSRLSNSRKQTADIQRVLLQAALQGDPGAKAAYEQAVIEAAQIVYGAYRQLNFEDRVEISYIGGLFNVTELFFKPFKTAVSDRIDIETAFIAPRLSPCEGAILLAIRGKCPEILDKIRGQMLNKQ